MFNIKIDKKELSKLIYTAKDKANSGTIFLYSLFYLLEIFLYSPFLKAKAPKKRVSLQVVSFCSYLMCIRLLKINYVLDKFMIERRKYRAFIESQKPRSKGKVPYHPTTKHTATKYRV